MKKEVRLMKGNEVLAEAAIRCGADGYFGYPITPQSEIMETLMELKPWETPGMVVLQHASEVAAIYLTSGARETDSPLLPSSPHRRVLLMSV